MKISNRRLLPHRRIYRTIHRISLRSFRPIPSNTAARQIPKLYGKTYLSRPGCPILPINVESTVPKFCRMLFYLFFRDSFCTREFFPGVFMCCCPVYTQILPAYDFMFRSLIEPFFFVSAVLPPVPLSVYAHAFPETPDSFWLCNTLSGLFR